MSYTSPTPTRGWGKPTAPIEPVWSITRSIAMADLADTDLTASDPPTFLGLTFSRLNAATPTAWDLNANGLEWDAPSPPGHGNFDRELAVHRGPYEYAAPGFGKRGGEYAAGGTGTDDDHIDFIAHHHFSGGTMCAR